MNCGSRFRLLQESVTQQSIEDLARQYSARMDGDRAKPQRMALYAQSGQCRWKELLGYFGEDEGLDRCGTCDNCTHPPEQQYTPPVDRERQEMLARAATVSTRAQPEDGDAAGATRPHGVYSDSVRSAYHHIASAETSRRTPAT